MTATQAGQQEWTLDAACRGCDAPAWDLTDGYKQFALNDDNHAAIRVCKRCPVQIACAQQAIASAERGDPPVGVIRAGVPLRIGNNFRVMSETNLAQLRAVADGGS